MLSALIIFLIGCVSLYLTLTRGAAHTFVVLYLPVLLLVSYLPKVNLPFMPDASSHMAVGYGILFAWLLMGGENKGFTWHPIDTMIIVLAASTVITKIATEQIYTGVSEAGQQFFTFFLPYYLARMTFAHPASRPKAMKAIAVCASFICFFAVIEARLWPFFLSRQLKALGLSEVHNTMAMGRWGFFRAQTLFPHPIDQGNSGVLLGALLIVLAYTAGRNWRDKTFLFGITACCILVFTSLSFTSFLAAIVAVAAFAVLAAARFTYMLLVPGIVLAILIGISFTTMLINVDPGPRPGPDTPALEASLWMRTVIVQNAWGVAEDAGLFGFGNLISKDQLNLDSVDNSYLLFLMTRGWVFIVLILTLPVMLAWSGARALARARQASERIPLAAGLAGVYGTFAAMYTVWFGFVYSLLTMILLGLTVSMIQVLLGNQAAVAPQAQLPAGTASLPAGPPPGRGIAAGGMP
ncbi:MAG: hypothetical protein ACFCVE_14745 [Phycisphaerae bacterium]